jgi:predicted RNase H-like nuclease (RuvC/YqgF family)
MDIQNLKIPIALAAVILVQAAAGVWWIAQLNADQNSTINQLKDTVQSLDSRLSVESKVNLARDVSDNTEYIETLWEDYEELEEKIEAIELKINTIELLIQKHEIPSQGTPQ